MNLAIVLAAAKRAQAAYLDDVKQAQSAFAALGHTFIGQYQSDSHQAVLSRQNGDVYLSISGTRFSSGKLGDLFDDIDLAPVSVGQGAQVARGAYDGLDRVWAWAQAQVPPSTVFNVEGHSLGGWRTAYTPLFLPLKRIGLTHCFESPKAGNAAFWHHFGLPDTVSTVNGADIWYGYPWLGDWRHPARDQLWLGKTGFQVIQPAQWPKGFSLADHSIDLVVNRLEKIVADPSHQSTGETAITRLKTGI